MMPQLLLVYLWRAVDAEGEVLDVLVQRSCRKNPRGTLSSQRNPPRKILIAGSEDTVQASLDASQAQGSGPS
jgi:transposase-like protein